MSKRKWAIMHFRKRYVLHLTKEAKMHSQHITWDENLAVGNFTTSIWRGRCIWRVESLNDVPATVR